MLRQTQCYQRRDGVSKRWELDDFCFKPTSLTLKQGEKLTLKLENEGKATHTFTVRDLNVDVTVQ